VVSGGRFAAAAGGWMLGKGKLVGRKDYRRSGEGKGREKRGRRRGGIAPWGGCCGTDV